jgi:hypothetical protein
MRTHMQCCPYSVKHVGATLGISDDVFMCILCLSAGTLTVIA